MVKQQTYSVEEALKALYTVRKFPNKIKLLYDIILEERNSYEVSDFRMLIYFIHRIQTVING